MNKKIIFVVLSILINSSITFSQTTNKKEEKKISKKSRFRIHTLIDSTSYALGFNIAQDLKSRGFTTLNYNLLSKAMMNVFEEGESPITKEQSQQIIITALTKAKKDKYGPTLNEGIKFLAENKKKPNVVSLPSGLQYEVLQATEGDKPKATDQVTVHYKGTLINGQQFDSSYDRKEPATFSLSGVIPGWTEGVQLMPIGSKYRFTIPYELAYGENGAGENIPPYSVLIFDIELIKINTKEINTKE